MSSSKKKGNEKVFDHSEARIKIELDKDRVRIRIGRGRDAEDESRKLLSDRRISCS